jgi:competence protein ComEC
LLCHKAKHRRENERRCELIIGFRGWNITIIRTALYSLADGLRLSRRQAFWDILITIWLYTLFAGATPNVIRAKVLQFNQHL